MARLAEREQHLAFGRVAADDVIAVVGEPDRVVGADMDRMRPLELALAPRAEEGARAIEHHDGVRAAVEDVDVVLAVDADRGDVAEGPAVGQLRPGSDRPR